MLSNCEPVTSDSCLNGFLCWAMNFHITLSLSLCLSIFQINCVIVMQICYYYQISENCKSNVLIILEKDSS